MAFPHARSINQLFVLGTLLVCSPLIIGLALSVYYVQRMYDRSEVLVARGLELGRESERLSGQIAELERSARQYIVVGNENVFSLYRQRHERLQDTLEWLALLVNDDEARALIADIRTTSGAVMSGLREGTGNLDSDAVGTRFELLRERAERLNALATERIRTRLEDMGGTTRDARTFSYLVGAIALAAMSALLMLSVAWITRPIRDLDTSIRRLGGGNLTEPVKIAGPEDVSRLADRLDWLRRRVLEIDEAKDQFIREMSHQLKTPLASIREGTELLLDGSVEGATDVQREVMEILHQNSLELQRMLENLLGFRAWRTSPKQLNRESIDLVPLIEAIVERYGISVMSKSIDIHVECPAKLVIDADRSKMRVIVDNLLSNAVKFTPPGGSIEIRANAIADGIVLDVIDGGPGIPETERDIIFELFYQGAHTSEQLRGTGVGLALVRAYVEAHGGSIEIIDEEEPKGHFRVYIP